MTRRLIATIALSAVFVTPLAALWCAYTCAEDDDATPTVVARATVWANPFPGPATGGAALAAHDNCAADLTNSAILATFGGRATHTVTLVVSLLAVPTPMSVFSGSASHPATLFQSPGSPPGARSFSVLRV